MLRCWGSEPPEFRTYHDDEWGRPVTDDVRLYEKLCLEGFQCGMSWLTIFRKRDNFRVAFAEFDPAAVARFGQRDVKRLLNDAGIVRNRGKIEAAIANALATLDVQESEGSLAALVWRYAPTAHRKAPPAWADIPASTPESTALSKELRRRQFRFVGPTTVYAAMQALGLVNDHLVGCPARSRAERERMAALAAMESSRRASSTSV